MRQIDIFLFDQVNLLDVAGPAQTFNSARAASMPLYKTRFVSADGDNVTACCGLKLAVDGAATENSSAEYLIIPGGMGVDNTMRNLPLQSLLQAWSENTNKKLVSVCSGALLLANAGVLNNRNATTHWSRSAQVLRDFPQVNWQIDRLYINDGNIYTSAGVTTGIDLSLSLIQRDHDSDTALAVARELVVYIQRPGGQCQFSGVIDLQLQSSNSLTGLVNAIVQHPSRSWTVESMSEFCHLTERTLTRHFHKHLDTSPKRFLEKVRVNKACELLSAGVPLHLLLSRCGLNDYQQMQRAFKRQLGTSVSQYTERFSVSAGGCA